MKPGDEITASTHASRVHVEHEDARGVIHGRRINRDGKPGGMRVKVFAENLTTVRLKLPLEEEKKR